MSKSLFVELKRRNVFKVGVAYLVLAWVVVQVTSEAVPALNMPLWMNTVVFYLGLIGFPFALFFAWAFEITPDGIKKENEIDRSTSITHTTSRNLDYIIIGLLIVGMGYFIWESHFSSNTTTSTSSKADPSAELQKPKGASIAVLPFINMSEDAANEYFSDGISEEILNVLAKLPNLHVTSRSSAFAFKGTKINISEVAKKLGVQNILEGSVRKSGNRIRITAQLIDARSDMHLWSETYDRELVDIFAIQDEISAAIVDVLKGKLGLDIEVHARNMKDVNLDAHNEYLQGKFFIEKRTVEDINRALKHFDNAITLAPNYAPAWTGKARAIMYLSEQVYGNIPDEVSYERAKPVAEQALLLDPELPEAHAILGLLEVGANNNKAIEQFKAAVKLNPNYADAYTWYGETQYQQPVKQLSLRKTVLRLSPMSLLANINYGESLLYFGRIKEAIELVNKMRNIDKNDFRVFGLLAFINGSQNKIADAAFNAKSMVKHNPIISFKLYYSTLLDQVAVPEEITKVLEGTEFEVIGNYYIKNYELFNSQMSVRLPRSESDSLGSYYRAFSEMLQGNYREAIKYLKIAKCTVCVSLIYSYQQVGDIDRALTLLKKRVAQYKELKADGVKNRFDFMHLHFVPMPIIAMNIAYLEGDYEQAIQHLQEAVSIGYRLPQKYTDFPMYEKLRAQPEWSTIKATSDKRALEQRKIYLKLVAEEAKTVK